jgi:hypothetical protein
MLPVLYDWIEVRRERRRADAAIPSTDLPAPAE